MKQVKIRVDVPDEIAEEFKRGEFEILSWGFVADNHRGVEVDLRLIRTKVRPTKKEKKAKKVAEALRNIADDVEKIK